MKTLTRSITMMTSHEIAELVEKRHDNVKRTIETLVNQGVIESPQIEEIPTATKPVSMYVFSGERGKRDSIVVVAQLSPAFTARLVDRWQELETAAASPAPQLPDFTNPAVAARAWADEVEQKLALASTVAEQAPKVEVYERIADAAGSLCLRDAAKTLQMQPLKLNSWLQANGWIYKRVGKRNWLAYQTKIQAGYLIHKSETYTDSKDGEEKISDQVRVTPLGLTKLAQLLDDPPSKRLGNSSSNGLSAGMH